MLWQKPNVRQPEHPIDRFAPLVIALAALAFEANGTPVLRQDWPPPLHSVGESLGAITGWDTIGLGSPVGYPTSFVIVFARALVAQFAGPFVAHLLTMAVIWLLVATGAEALASRCGARRLGQHAAALFVTFNSWTYTELVAGHIYVLLAFGATLWLIAETMRWPGPRPLLVSALVLAVAPQIQYLVIDAPLFVVAAIRARDARPAVVIVSLGVLIATTIILSRSNLVGIPLKLEWERGLSLPPIDAVLVRGYFTRYSAALDPIAAIGVWATLGCAVIGFIVARKNIAFFCIATMTVCAVVATTGTKGPIALPFVWLIGHFSEIGLFRELYTLAGFSLIGYVALAAFAVARFPPVGILWVLGALSGLIAWMAFPPAAWWVVARDVPKPRIPETGVYRYALMPAYPPLTFHGTGSGIDPNLIAGPKSSGPIDEYTASFPVDTALGHYLKTNDVRPLAGLSVAAIVVRPWLDERSVTRGATALPIPTWLRANVARATLIPSPLPPLTLSQLPAVGSLLQTPGAGNMQLGDGTALCRITVARECGEVPQPVVASNEHVEAQRAWVDARLAFYEAPELGQSYGGALTTSSTETLPIEGGKAALLWLAGTLRDGISGRILASGTGSWSWIPIPHSVSSVRCFGRCLVAAQLSHVPTVPLEPQARHATALPFRPLLPWLLTASIPPGKAAALRYEVRYNTLWQAYVGGKALPHVRIDAAVNGFFLPARTMRSDVVVVEWGAVVTALLELVFTAILIAVFATARLRRR